jgi:enoyl-CoA hydratase
VSVSETEAPAEPEVLFSRDGHLAHIVLNRPKAMNALTHGMAIGITGALEAWANDDAIRAVVVSGAGDRALCAGGDIVSLYRDILDGGAGAARFWADEYDLNARIAEYPKPYVAIMDGVVLGGGVGISAHGSDRVVTERTKIGMPEVGIGFVPDVGGTWLLSRAPGELGTHAGLTGGTFGGADALALGLADYYVESDRLPELVEALGSMSVADAMLRFTTDAPPSTIAGSRSWIDECYASDDAAEILDRLEASSNEDARATAAIIRTKSPTAVAVTLESLRRARRLGSLEEALDQEYRVSVRFAVGTEMPEGIRAQVIDKDRSPRWNPATLPEISREQIDAYFAPLGRNELGLSAPTTAREG